MLLRDGRVVPVTAVRIDPFNGKVYNFSVAELESYAVGNTNVLVHNTGDCFNAPGEPGSFGDAAEAYHHRNNIYDLSERAFKAAEYYAGGDTIEELNLARAWLAKSKELFRTLARTREIGKIRFCKAGLTF